jgi:amino acid adenylation domain-containing protein
VVDVTDIDTDRIQAARRRLLEQRVRGAAPAASSAGTAPVVRAHTTGPVPLSVSQRQLWYHMQVHPQSTTYNEMITVRKDGRFDIEAFRRAFNELISRYESWRTAFRIVDDEPQQIVERSPGYELPLLDLSDRPFDEAERDAADLAAADTRPPYDLAAGHLIRPRLVRLAPDHHRLYLGLHHLIFDGVTLQRVLLPDLVALYDAFAAGAESPLSEPPLQYVDYAEWERDWVAGPAVAARIERCRSRLGNLATVELPLDHPRPSRPHRGGGMVPIIIERDLVTRLRQLGQRHGASLFQVLAAAYSWWLHCYAGRDEVTFATMCDLRQRPELTSLVGYCLSPVVLRGDLSGEPTFIELIARTRTEALDAIGDVVPFEHLVRELGGPRDPRRNPLFQATLVLEPLMTTPDPEWSVHLMETAIANAVGQAKFDIGVELDERPDGHITGRLGYDADLFEPGTAEQMARHLVRLLDLAAADPNRPLAELDLLDDRDRPTLVAAAVSPVTTARCVHDVIAERAALVPDAVAVMVGDESLSYAELMDRAGAVARRLVAAGAGRGTVVATYFDRTPGLVVGLLGVLMSGAAYLPLDPRAPGARSAFMVEDAGATLLLTRESLRPSLPTTNATTVVTVDDPQASPPPTSATPAGSPSDLAYVMYTSGSTGRPKGVLVEHGSVSNLLSTLLPRLGVGAGDTVLSVASYTFDMSVGDIFGSLALGARLVLATSEQAADPTALAALIDAADVSLLSATPATWSALLDAGWAGAKGLTASSGGESLTPAVAQALLERCAGLWNCYGPTEATDVVCCGAVVAGQPIAVGRPLDGTWVYVLDEHDRPVPAGVPGEIVIGGAGVAGGYVDRPAETARYFADDPFRPGGRVYRTGDRGRWLADGQLQHLGRYDDQLKVRGFRIEPGEIEAVLREHPEVTAAAVLARERHDGDKQLVAYVVGAADDTALRAWLRSRLPDHMIPAAIIGLSELPLTSGGKLDRAALPDPASIRGAATAIGAGQPPLDLTPTQEQLRSLWSALLDHEVVDVNADFFDLGGHSLLAARLILEMRRRLGADIALADFLERGTTIAGSAALVDAESASSVEPTEFAADDSALGLAGRTLFFVYPDLASAVSLRHLTAAWSSDQLVVPLIPVQRFGRFDRSKGVEGLAAPMIKAVRDRQPHGPYVLAGYSFGGLIAYDIARLLLAAGEQVVWLGMVDTLCPTIARRMPKADPMRVRIVKHLRRNRAERAAKYAKVAQRSMLAAGMPSPELADDHNFDYRGALVLGSRYSREGTDVPVELFTTEESVAQSSSETLGWDEFHRGPLSVHHFLGNHSTLLDVPDVGRLADLVMAALQRTRTSV